VKNEESTYVHRKVKTSRTEANVYLNYYTETKQKQLYQTTSESAKNDM
jgi:hypothetical protein